MPIYIPGATSLIPAGCPRIEDDFTYNGIDVYGRWNQTGSGVFSFPQITPTTNQQGVMRLQLGVTNGDAAFLFRGLGAIVIPNAFWQFNVGLSLPALSTPADQFIIRVGLGDVTNFAADQNNGVYFEYSDNLSAGQWRMCTAAGGVRTKNASARFAAPGKVSLKAFGVNNTQAVFSINGALTGVSQGTFPTGAPLALFLGIGNQTTSVARAVDIDYFAWYYNIPAR